MPEPTSIATSAGVAVAILAEYFKGAISKAGGDLYDYLKQSFAGNQAAEIALKEAQNAPEAYLPAVRHHIQSVAEEDESFFTGLLHHIEASTTNSSNIAVIRSRHVAITTGSGNASVEVKGEELD